MYTEDQLRIAKLENVHRIDGMIAKLKEAHDVQGASGQSHAITHTVRELQTLRAELIDQNNRENVVDENDPAYPGNESLSKVRQNDLREDENGNLIAADGHAANQQEAQTSAVA